MLSIIENREQCYSRVINFFKYSLHSIKKDNMNKVTHLLFVSIY